MKTFEILVAERKKQLIQDNLDDLQQKQIIEKANQLITAYRQDCFNLCFTNYRDRDRNRKRISFKEAYDFASLSYNLLKSTRK